MEKEETKKNNSVKLENLRLSNEESNRISRESLCEALICLTTEKKFDKISITELVKRAGVSRATFYRNYQTKNDVIDDITEQLSEEFVKFLNSSIINYDGLFETFFSLCLEKEYVIKAIFKSDIFFHSLLNISSILEKYIMKKGKNNRYEILAFEGAFFNLFKDWVNRGFVESPEKMAKICSKTLRLT